MKQTVYSNSAHPGATVAAWGNQGLTGKIQDGEEPDRAQWQALAKAAETGKPLYREWNKTNYTWPAGSPILMDLEPLWFSDKRPLEERIFWHTTVAQWIRDEYPECKLFSFTGTAPLIGMYDVTLDDYRQHVELAAPFLKRLTEVSVGTYFGAHATWDDYAAVRRLLGTAAIATGRKVQMFTKPTYAAEWTPRNDDELPAGDVDADHRYLQRLCTFRDHYTELRLALQNYQSSWFAWTETNDPLYLTAHADLCDRLLERERFLTGASTRRVLPMAARALLPRGRAIGNAFDLMQARASMEAAA